MYQPPAFRQDDPKIIQNLIEDFPLGLLISNGRSGIEANSIPFLYDPNKGEFGTLYAHLSKANLQLKHFATGGDGDTLVVFQGTNTYISPSHYASKKLHGKVVPTWNYAMVQARGNVELHTDCDWLHAHVTSLTNIHEAGRNDPWKTTDAPEKFIAANLKGITGISMRICALDAKFKLSQNKPEIDQASVIDGLQNEHKRIADMIEAMSSDNKTK